MTNEQDGNRLTYKQFLAEDIAVKRILRRQLARMGAGNIDEYVRLSGSPAAWSRLNRYKVGSNMDKRGGLTGGGMNYADTPAFVGGIIREFKLNLDIDITLVLLELNGKLSVIDNLNE